MTRPDDTAIRLKCPRCFNHLQAVESQVGSKRRCPKCLHIFVVPSAEEVARRQPKVEPYAMREGTESVPEVDQPHLPLRCPLCRTHLQAREDQIGEQIVCPDCHTSVLVERPDHEPAVLTRKKETSPVAGGDDYGLIDEVDASTSRRRAADPTYFATHCPLCGTHMQAREDQVGQEMTCPDCRRTMIVPAAPPRRRSSRGPREVDKEAAYGVRAEGEPTPDATATSYIPVVCPLCKTRLHTTEDQIGQKMVCPDCDRLFAVPPPPKPERTYDPRDQFDGNYDVGESVASAPSGGSPILASLWHRHMGSRGENDRPPSPPPRRPFLSSVFSIPWSPSVRMHFLPLWVLGMIVVAVVARIVSLLGGAPGIAAWTEAMVLMGVASVLGTIWLGVLSVKCLAILGDTADGYDDVQAWPEGPFLDWVGEVFFVVNSLAIAMLPGVLISKLLVVSVGQSTWWIVPLGIVVMFPVMLMSMLEANSPMMPLSRHVWRSLLRVWRAWGCFYIETTLIIAAVGGLIFGMSDLNQWLAVPIASAALVAAAMIYFRLLGRVAWCYARAVHQDEREAAEAEDEE